MSQKVIVHLIRHGHIPSHESDVALTDEGWEAAYRTGQQFATIIEDGEQVVFLHGPSRRTRETAWRMYEGLQQALAASGRTNSVQVAAPVNHPDLCNVRLWMDGELREAMRLFYDAVQAAYQADPSPENTDRLRYHRGFWESEDPMGYWLKHPSPHAETPDQIITRLRRVITESLAQLPPPTVHRRRVLCITHSGPMRALLRQVLGADPGEPDFCEGFTVERVDDHRAQVVFRGWVVEFARALKSP